MNREAVRELIMNYGEFLEKEDYSETAVREIFAEDAEVKFAIGGTGTGISAIAVGHRKMMESFVSAHHNITNLVFDSEEDACAKIRFHMEVIHEFRPEIAAHTPGNLFIVNDRILAEARREGALWKLAKLQMKTVYKRMVSTAESTGEP